MIASILTKVIRVIQATAAIPIATQITVGVEAEVEVELGVTLLDPKIKIHSNRKMLMLEGRPSPQPYWQPRYDIAF